MGYNEGDALLFGCHSLRLRCQARGFANRKKNTGKKFAAPFRSVFRSRLACNTVTDSLRIALLLDPLSIRLEDPLRLRVKWGNHAPQLARELLGRGHTVRGFGAPPGLVPRSSEEASEDETGIRPRRGLWRTAGSFAPDIVLAYDPLSPAAFRGAWMARRQGAALVLVEAALRGGGWWQGHVLRTLGRWSWGNLVRRRSSWLVALDPVARAQALGEGFEAEEITMIPHGVNLDHFRPGLTSTIVARHRVRGRILLYVGRIEGGFGLETLIHAFARTVGQRNDWSLVVAGEGAAQPRLRALTERLGIAGLVHWPGRPRREELPGLLGASTLFAVPALDDAVLGRQAARALACGVPVLASDVPRLRALVENQHSGLLARPGDVGSWSETIRLAAGSPIARQRWARNARMVAQERLGWPAVARQFEELFTAAKARDEVRRAVHRAARRAGGSEAESRLG